MCLPLVAFGLKLYDLQAPSDKHSREQSASEVTSCDDMFQLLSALPKEVIRFVISSDGLTFHGQDRIRTGLFD